MRKQFRGTVLVVEDEPMNAELVSRLLTDDGFSVDVVRDGAAALAAIALRPPDVVLLDWMLPRVTGIEVCERACDRWPASSSTPTNWNRPRP